MNSLSLQDYPAVEKPRLRLTPSTWKVNGDTWNPYRVMPANF